MLTSFWRKSLYLAVVLSALGFGLVPSAWGQNAPDSVPSASAIPVYSAKGASTPWAENEHGRVRLISTGYSSGNTPTMNLALHFQTQPDWHIYWRSPGDAGYPPKIDWAGSVNIKSAEFLWPVPHRYSVGNIETIGYTGDVVLPISVTLAQAGAQTVANANLDYLTCKDICVPHQYQFQLQFYVGPFLPSPDKDLIEFTKTLVPDKDSSRSMIGIRHIFVGGTDAKPTLDIDAYNPNGFSNPDVFLESAAPFTFAKPKMTLNTDRTAANFSVAVAALDPKMLEQITRTPITVTVADGQKGHETTAIPMRMTAVMPFGGVIVMILLAFIGGVILNFMPCVLPVLSIKLIQIVGKHDHDHAMIRRGFLASAAGILVCFWVLAGIATLVKLLGHQAGWGMQFQHTEFLLLMIVILLAFAGNMWGLFEIRLPLWIANLVRIGRGEQSLSREFLTGMLATLLATPCSAPFLGTALGFALSQGAPQIFLIFTAVGLGLALPYMLVAVWPQSVHALPKPGRWMITLRRVLAVFLLMTAIWLGAIVVAQKTNWLDMPANAATSKTDLPWQYFDPNKIGQYVAAGKIVFVDVTADWCLTCKLNERVVINSAKIRELLTAPDVVLMRADWTRPDAVISAYLASFGRYGIPFNAVYSKSNPAGLPLPELLSESAVEAVMQSARQ